MTMKAYESGGLVPLSSYFIRSDVLGGMRPDQTYNFATNGSAFRLTLNLPSNTHPLAAADKISSGHAINITMNAYESGGLVVISSYFIRSDVLGGMRPDQTLNFATHG